MDGLVSWAASAVVVLLVVAFLWHVVSLRRVPTGRRPRTNVYDRQGRPLSQAENPDFHQGPGEDSVAGPGLPDDGPARGGA